MYRLGKSKFFVYKSDVFMSRVKYFNCAGRDLKVLNAYAKLKERIEQTACVVYLSRFGHLCKQVQILLAVSIEVSSCLDCCSAAVRIGSSTFVPGIKFE